MISSALSRYFFSSVKLDSRTKLPTDNELALGSAPSWAVDVKTELWVTKFYQQTVWEQALYWCLARESECYRVEFMEPFARNKFWSPRTDCFYLTGRELVSATVPCNCSPRIFLTCVSNLRALDHCDIPNEHWHSCISYMNALTCLSALVVQHHFLRVWFVLADDLTMTCYWSFADSPQKSSEGQFQWLLFGRKFSGEP